MTAFFLFSLKTIIGLGIFILVYQMIFTVDYNFMLRRYYLLTSVFLAFVLPLIPSGFTGIFPLPETIDSVFLDEITIYSNGLKQIEESSRIPFGSISTYIYISIAAILSLRIFYQIADVLIKSRRYKAKKADKIKIYRLPFLTISFSFFHFVFIGKTPEKGDFEKILAHEKVHARQLHTVDVLIMEILTVLFWFNPLIWWTRKEIKNVHEYLADEGALNEGFNQKSYQITILEHLIGSASLSITNNFNYSLIKNRIKMMNSKKNTKKNVWKIFLLIPLSIILVIGFACTEKDDNQGLADDSGKKSELYFETAYQEVDIMAEYPGGFGELRKFIAVNLKYPEEALKNGVQGKVFVQFVVDKEGKVVTSTKEYRIEGDEKTINEVVVVAYDSGSDDESKVDPEIRELLEKEAVRVVSKLPDFDSPAKKNGKPVAVAFTLPITFALQ